MSWEINKAKYGAQLASALLYHEAGKVTKSMGLVFEAHLPGASVGSLCRILTSSDRTLDAGIDVEVIGFKDKRIYLMPFEDAMGINNDSLVVLRQKVSTVHVGSELLGRVLNGRGMPIDGKGPIQFTKGSSDERSLYNKPSDPLKRKIIDQPLDLGVRAINSLVTCGKGQRVGIFAGSGVGKSVLLGMMAKYTSADINVIALIGERGREVREFIDNDLGEEGLKRSVVIVATSDASPLLRMRAAFLAATVSEYFRDQGNDVLFLMDSITRFCMAQREIGLSMGEPPASKGYTPSVFSTLPKLLERFGTTPHLGSSTGLFTVLVEGDDIDDPIADSSKSILDGHITLARKLVERNHYPAVDVLQSTSRVMQAVVTPEHQKWAAEIREWLAVYNQVEDLVNLGAYVRGANSKIDQAIAVHDRIMQFLRQERDQRITLEESKAQMQAISRAGEAFLSAQAATQAVKRDQKPSKGMGF